MKLIAVTKACILFALLPCHAVWALEGTSSSKLLAKKITSGASEKPLTPQLEKFESNHKFFKKDYVDDSRAPTYHHFDHPYPEVQDSDHYDRDYVQDENDDKGEWAAQWGYDSQKNKLTNEKSELQRALAREQENKKQWEDAIAAEKKAEAEARAAEKAREAAEKHHAEMENNHENINATIDKKADKVEGEVKDLEDCKKQLEKVRKQLKSLLEEKAKWADLHEDAEKALEGLEAEELRLEKLEEELEKKVDDEHQEYLDSIKQTAKEKKDVKRAEAELEEAAKTLRKFRTADADGGVYPVKAKGGAMGFKSFLPFALMTMQVLHFLC